VLKRIGLDTPSKGSFGDQFAQGNAIGIQQFGDAAAFDARGDDQASLGVDITENAKNFHSFRLLLVVPGGAQVMHPSCMVAMDQEQVRQSHQALATQGEIERILIPDREHFAAVAILKVREHDISDFAAHDIEDAEFEELRARGERPQLRMQ